VITNPVRREFGSASSDSKQTLARTLQTCLLLTLSAKAESDGLGGAEISTVHGQSTAIVACSPGANAALGLCVLSEDEAEHDVQAAHGKEEKRGDKREFANVVGEDRCPDAKRAIRIRGSVPMTLCTRRKEKGTYSPWKIPRGPRPNCDPRTGKKRSKKAIGHEISDKRRKTS
jgi:hypothetical protein